MKWLFSIMLLLIIVIGVTSQTGANTVKDKEPIKTSQMMLNKYLLPDFNVNSDDFVIIELVDDNGFHFKGRVRKTETKMQSTNGFNIYITTNLGNTCTFPDCGYQGGVRYCCEGMGNCWKC